MRSLGKSLSAIVAMLVVCLATPAAAQMDWMTPHLQSIEFGRQLDQIVEASQGYPNSAEEQETRQSSPNPAPRPQTQATQADFSFTSSPARTQTNLRNFVSRTPDAAARADLQRMVTAQPTIIAEVGEVLRGCGFDPYNMADAYAVWLITAWQVYEQQDREPTSAEIEAVKRQVRQALTQTPGMLEAGDAERQEFAEALILQAIILTSGFEQLQGDQAMLDQFAQATLQGALNSGVDLRRMALTDNGFEAR